MISLYHALRPIRADHFSSNQRSRLSLVFELEMMNTGWTISINTFFLAFLLRIVELLTGCKRFYVALCGIQCVWLPGINLPYQEVFLSVHGQISESR